MEWYWIVLTVVAVMAFAALLVSAYERRHPVLTVCDVAAPALDRRESPLKILFLSDLHNAALGKGNERLLKLVREAAPDRILLGGDMLTAKYGKVRADNFFALVPELLKTAPLYLAVGNHEERLYSGKERYRSFLPEYEEKTRGAVHLNGRTVTDETSAGPVRITGFSLPDRYYHGTKKKALALPDAGPADAFRILLIHSPMYFDEARKAGYDLTLSGHFHGGTVRIPGLGGLMTPQYQFFYRYTRGIFTEEGKTMAVSGGLGTHSVNLRILNRPEAVLIRLHGEKERYES